MKLLFRYKTLTIRVKLNLLTKTKSFAFSRHFIKTINLNYGYIAKPFKK
jgi:hypothetical protein